MRKKLVRRTQQVLVPAVDYVFEPVCQDRGCGCLAYTDVEQARRLATVPRMEPQTATVAGTMISGQPLPPIVASAAAQELTVAAPDHAFESDSTAVVRYLSPDSPVEAMLVPSAPAAMPSLEPPRVETARQNTRIYRIQ